MADINRVILVGRMTRDAELKHTQNGFPVSKFSLAINKNKKVNDEWIPEVNYFDIVLWGKTAESLDPYLKRGKQIGVEGELKQNRWEQDGQKRSKIEVIATNIQLLGGKNDSNDSQAINNDDAPF